MSFYIAKGENQMRRIIVGAAIAVLAACAAAGVKVSDEQVAKLTKGQTTYAQVIASLGRPTSEITRSDGSRFVVYSYAQTQVRGSTFIPIVGAFAGGGDTSSQAVVLTFDRTGVLQDYTSSKTQIGSGTGLSSGTGPQPQIDQPRQQP